MREREKKKLVRGLFVNSSFCRTDCCFFANEISAEILSRIQVLVVKDTSNLFFVCKLSCHKAVN
jgi:hypothetical protein